MSRVSKEKDDEWDGLSLEDRVLVNLSYLEPMRFEQIILDFDTKFLEANPDFDRETLMKILDTLVKKKKVKLIKSDSKKKEDYQWQRVYPRRSSFWDWLPWRRK